jgi:hypothetical protein
MNPEKGLDLIRTRLVKDVRVEEGRVAVRLDLPSDHQFANNIREEIIEKIEPLWDVEQVEVEFSD